MKEEKLIAIGDIHGCLDELKLLIEMIEYDGLTKDDRVIFLGDYIDRGKDSKGVIDFVIEFKKKYPKTITLLGNHEEMCLGFYKSPKGKLGQYWLQNGGNKTRKSYSYDIVSKEHIEFMENCELFFLDESENYLFVHAGIDVDLPLEEQDTNNLLWIREDFYFRVANANLPYTVVHGHTPGKDVIFDLPYRICVDTGCVYDGKLSAIRIIRQDAINSIVYSVSGNKDNAFILKNGIYIKDNRTK